MAWAVSAAFTCELEAQKMQKVMMLLLLGAEDIEELTAVCYYGAGRAARVTARSRDGQSWAAERVCWDAARVRTLECFGFVWRLLLWRACAVAPCSCAFVRDPCMGR